jgi:hypothetical protein
VVVECLICQIFHIATGNGEIMQMQESYQFYIVSDDSEYTMMEILQYYSLLTK